MYQDENKQAWLLKMYQDENKPLEALINRLQAEQHLEMMRLMAAHPQEGTAREDTCKKCCQGSSRVRVLITAPRLDPKSRSAQ